ncbi:uncharacterized protein zgc:113425 isoform X2 [Clupea harengus]|uniref:Uncharacterized protein zgc:113425 isoform X2 n=1 Tax=Clupea harengus TaxID=7950 RepID=A0A6P3W5G8_CLUHA|nr:uncharacterized protein zgc:113425 isoform X2 [Clupea harengus]
MDRYRYFVFNQRSVVVLGILQVACAGLCMVCGVMDAFFRKTTTLSTSRAPLWSALIMAVPGVLALFAAQRKNPILVSVMLVSSLFSCVAVVIVFTYAGLTLSYGEEDDEIFHHHIPEVKFVLGRMVRGANGTMLLTGVCSLLFSSLIALLGCRSLPFCACYDGLTGLESLVPQNDPSTDTELVCTWQGGDDRLFNSPVTFVDRCVEKEQEEPSRLPPYVSLT